MILYPSPPLAVLTVSHTLGLAEHIQSCGVPILALCWGLWIQPSIALKNSLLHLHEFWKFLSPSGIVLSNKVLRNTIISPREKGKSLTIDNFSHFRICFSYKPQQHLSELTKTPTTTLARRFIATHKRMRIICTFVDSELIFFPNRGFPLEKQTPVLHLFY